MGSRDHRFECRGPERRRPSLRQRDELRLPGNRIETAGLPVLFGLFDPLLARGHEVPPDVTGSSIAAPPRNITREGRRAVNVMRSPALKTSRRGPSNRSPEISISPSTT